MKKLGIIDLGSNSVRLILVSMGENGNYKIINDVKESLRLQEDLGKSSDISKGRIKKGLTILKMFKDLCDSNRVEEIIAVGTESLRQARNGKLFIEEVEKACSITIKILSGEEEAYYDYLAVRSSLPLKKCLILDIGGGSSELILLKDRKMKASISLPFGAITLSQMFSLQDEISEEREKALEQYLQGVMKTLPWLKEAKNLPMVAIGGSLRNIARIDRQRKDYPLDIVHNYEMELDDVKEILKLLKKANLIERQKIKGLSKERADIIVGAAASLAALMEYCNASKLIFSGHGIREGLIYDSIQKMGIEIDDPTDFSIANSMYNFDLHFAHANKVYELSTSLYKQLKPLHQLNEKPKKLIKTAAMLHEIGVNIAYYKHYKHSFYMIVNAGINGLNHKELLMSAYIAASKYKDGVKINLNRYGKLIDKTDVDIIHKVGVLIKIAEGLERNMNSNIAKLECFIGRETVIIEVQAKEGLDPEIIDLDILEAMRAADHFKKIYALNLEIKPAR